MITAANPKVWVVREQMRRQEIGSKVMDYSPAMKFGDLEFITTTDFPLHPKSSVRKSWGEEVSKFCEAYDNSRDFIICTGQPIAMFLVGWWLAQWVKHPRFLVWSGQTGEYVPVTEGGLTKEQAEAAFSHMLNIKTEIAQ